MIIGLLFRRFYKKHLKLIINQIKELVNVEKIYNESFKKLNLGLEYLSTKDNISKFLKSEEFTEKDILSNSITDNEIVSFNYGVSRGGRLVKKSTVKHMLIDDKYPLSFVNSIFETSITDLKGNDIIVFKHKRGLLKIDTRKLGDKAFNFTIFKNKKIFGKREIRLENNEFNNRFGIIADDELKARKMYTPLSMELSLKRLDDTSGSMVNKMYITSTSDSIYFEYSVPMNFMELDIPNSLNAEEIIYWMYEDFLYDTYTLYWILSIIYIPTYLDKK